MTLLFITGLIGIALGLVLANYSIYPTERYYARFLVLAGVMFVGIAWWIQ